MSPTRLVAVFAHPIVLGPIAGATAIACRHKPGVAPRLLIALPLSVAASKVAKRLHPRHKPRLLTLTPRESFPSGHGTATAALAFSLVDAFSAWRAIPIAIAAIALVDASRVHDDEHRISEVLIGNAIGLAGAVVASLIARRISRRARDSARADRQA
jgi:membrane-associated phospholipid phosphatase